MPLRFEGNTFRHNQNHLVVMRGDGSVIVNNRFEGSAPGTRAAGLAVSGENVLVATNRFDGVGTGVVVLGNDPDFGTMLGIATNVQLVANQFCNVTNPVDIEPLATNITQQGTLLCPFPVPPLDIARAVLLSWPDDGETHLLEAAPDPQGPWSPLNATPTVQEGHATAAVKTDPQYQFFRLR